ncbi:MAG: hypothetical protein GY810_29380 [Aureispira sp.]|nr:hypothetical protein [Aureispira sp.]
MNKELCLLYNGLDAQRKVALDLVFEDSPKALKLLELLAQKEQQFKTTTAVNTIYKHELERVEYATLVNRFYKLRQHVKDRLLVQLKQTKNCFTPTELDLGYARYLKDISEYKHALEILEKLEEECWTDEKFELLPEIINLKIYCVQSLNSDMAYLEACEDNFLKAIELQKALQQIQLYAQRLHRKMFGVERVEETYELYQKSLRPIRKLKEKYSKVKRFRMLYHYQAFSSGVLIPKMVTKSRNALHRHLNSFMELWEQYPKIPLMHLQINFREYMQFRLCDLQSAFYFNKGDFANALKAVDQKYDLRKKYPSLCPRESEADYHNGIVICMCNNAYQKAWQLTEELLDFFERHDQHEHKYIAYYFMVSTYFFGFFDMQDLDIKELSQKIEEGLKLVKEERVLQSLRLAKLSLAILEGNAQVSSELLKNEVIQGQYKQLGLEVNDIQHYVEALGSKDVQALANLQSFFQEKQGKSVAPAQTYFEHFVKLCKYWQRELS